MLPGASKAALRRNLGRRASGGMSFQAERRPPDANKEAPAGAGASGLEKELDWIRKADQDAVL